MQTAKKTTEREGMDSGPLRRIPSPSSHFLHRIYSLPHLPGEEQICTNVREKTVLEEMAQQDQDCLVGAGLWDHPRGGLRPRRPWTCPWTPTIRENSCLPLPPVPALGLLMPSRVRRVGVGSLSVRSGAVVVSGC